MELFERSKCVHDASRLEKSKNTCEQGWMPIQGRIGNDILDVAAYDENKSRINAALSFLRIKGGKSLPAAL